jgi:hypothetical protein
MEGKQQTFALLDEWAPHARDLPREEALAELTRRFFTSQGPPTLADFARWSGLTLTDTKAGVRMNSTALTAANIDGTEYWLSKEQAEQALDEAAGVYLLPGFDEYVLGYKDRSAVLAAEHAQRTVRAAGWPCLKLDKRSNVFTCTRCTTCSPTCRLCC